MTAEPEDSNSNAGTRIGAGGDAPGCSLRRAARKGLGRWCLDARGVCAYHPRMNNAPHRFMFKAPMVAVLGAALARANEGEVRA